MGPPDTLNFTEDEDANRLLARDPLALLIGMLLDQQVLMEVAFRSPYLLSQRLGRDLDAADLASRDPEELVAAFQEKPALHRFPASMAKRTHALCSQIAEGYDGDAAAIWDGAADAKDLLRRLEALPGFGKAKSRIFVGLLAKRLGIAPEGWEDVAADWPSIADVALFEDVQVLREQKRAIKAAKKS